MIDYKTASKLISGNITFEKVSSVYNLAEALENYNKKIDSQVVLVYIPVNEGEEMANKLSKF